MDSAAITKYFKMACTKASLKVTHQRLKIYLELLRSDDHPTAETLFKPLRHKMPTLSLDTVYRTLGTFEHHGLIRRVKTVQSQARYEAEMKQHHHFICNSCGTVTDFDWPGFDHSLLPDEVLKFGSITERTVTISGICSKCADKTGKKDLEAMPIQNKGVRKNMTNGLRFTCR